MSEPATRPDHWEFESRQLGQVPTGDHTNREAEVVQCWFGEGDTCWRLELQDGHRVQSR